MLEAKKYRRLQKLGKARKQIFLQKFQKECSSADLFQTSDLQNSMRINLYCFKPLSLWFLLPNLALISEATFSFTFPLALGWRNKTEGTEISNLMQHDKLYQMDFTVNFKQIISAIQQGDLIYGRSEWIGFPEESLILHKKGASRCTLDHTGSRLN